MSKGLKQQPGVLGLDRIVPVDEWLKAKAKRLRAKSQFEESIHTWRSLLRRKMRSKANAEDLAEAHFHIGELHYLSHSRVKAVFHLRAALKFDSSLFRAHEYLARCLVSSGQWRSAKIQMIKALRLQPNNASLWRQYAWILLRMKDESKSVLAIRKSQNLDSEDESNFWVAVQIYTETGRWSELSRCLKLWKKKHGDTEKLGICLEQSRRRYRLSFQGSVHHLIRRRASLDGEPFNITHLRAAERKWLDFCESEKVFSKRRAHIRLSRVWAAASFYLVGIESDDLRLKSPLDHVSKRFEVKKHEVQAATDLLRGRF